MTFGEWLGTEPGEAHEEGPYTRTARAAWNAAHAELKRQILEEVLPDLHGYYDGRDVVEALRKRLEAL